MKYSFLLLLILACGFVGNPAEAAERLKLKYERTVYQDSTGTNLLLPEGVACTDDSLTVADSGNKRLVRYRFTSSDFQAIGEIPFGQGFPLLVQADSKGNLYVLDGRDRKILVFDQQGNAKGAFQPTGLPGRQEIVPRSFKIDNQDNLYLLDISSARVVVVDSSGRFQKQFSFPKDYGFFSDLAVDAGGNLFLLDSVNATVYAAKRGTEEFLPITGNMKGQMNFPTSLAPDNQGKLFLVDRYGSGIVIIGMDGSSLGRRLGMGRGEGFLYYPSQICISPKGALFIADTNNNRVQHFNLAE